MGSLTSCLKKAGDNLRKQDKDAIVAKARKLRSQGVRADEAALRAVDAQIAELSAVLEPGAQSAPAQSPEDAAKEAAKQRARDALAGIASLLSKNTRSNITPEQEKQLLPLLTELLSAAFDLGYLQFKSAAKWALGQIQALAGKEIADAITIDHLQGAYIAMAGSKQGADSKRDVVNVEDKAEIEAHDIGGDNVSLEADNVPSTPASVERDREVAGSEPAVGQPVSVDDLGAAARRPRGDREDTGSEGGRPESDPLLPADGPAAGGERGNQPVPGGQQQVLSSEFDAGIDDGERGGDSGIAGVPPESIPAGTVEQTAQARSERDKLNLQRAANSVEVKPGLENIRATLPYLLGPQQEDVLKAENRFAEPTGYGMLFTNGTGTGKTFSGLGIIKRFERQGKANTLVVVPDNKIAADWIASARALGLNIAQLADTKTAGQGIVITTYANLGENDELAKRKWDLVVADEAHSLMQSADGEVTSYLHNLRAITMHPDGWLQRYTMLNRKDIDAAAKLRNDIEFNSRIANRDDTMDAMVASLRAENERLERDLGVIQQRLDAAKKATKEEVQKAQGEKRTRAAFLSATPFAYEKTLDWANGYLFDYAEGYPYDTTSLAYNQPGPREHFFMTHLGYQMRYNKLTRPDKTKVDTGLLQRQLNGWMQKKGSLSGRMLDVPADYDRRFVLVDSAIGHKIDEALRWLTQESRNAPPKNDGFRLLRSIIEDKFDYLQRRYLLEAIKATEVIPIVKKHLELGRKVVVFHDYNKGGGFNPFSMRPTAMPADADADTKKRVQDYNQALESFRSKFKDLVEFDFASMPSPINVFRREFPDVMLINGLEKQRDLLARYTRFQDDASGPQVMLVQSDKNKGWSGHDTTGKHQRVLINLGQPTAPTKAIQQEGRIYRTGQVSNAIMRYLNTGTDWEKWAFATTIANRASEAENLGTGELARALKDSFIQAFEDSDTYPPGHEGEGIGGKAQDRANNKVISQYDRAKTQYWAKQKKNSKTKAQEGVDYFPTPEPIGLKMVEFLDGRGGDDQLEPSGGDGAIARWLPETTARTVIEPSAQLRPRLAMVMNNGQFKIIDDVFENHNVVNKYHGIVMNPPYGVGGKTAIEHLAKAATHLRDGGRIVALIPTGPAADKRFDKWFYDKAEKPIEPIGTIDYGMGRQDVYEGDGIKADVDLVRVEGIVREVTKDGKYLRVKIAGRNALVTVPTDDITGYARTGPRVQQGDSPADKLHLVADIKMPSVTFERAGTAVMTRIVVIERQDKAEKAPGQTLQRDLTDIDDINKLFDRMEDMTMPKRNIDESDAAAPPAAAQPAQQAPKADKPQRAGLGATVVLGDKEYTVDAFTTQAGKVKHGVWMDGRAEAQKFSPRTFSPRSHPGKWFVDEYWFPKTDGAPPVAREEAKVYTVNDPGSNYDIDLFPDSLEGLQAGAGGPAPIQRNQAAQGRDVHPQGAVQSSVLAVRQDDRFPGFYHVTGQLVEVGRRDLPVESVSNWDDAAAALSAMSRFAVEHFDVLITDKAGKPLAVVGSFKGTMSAATVYPGTVLQEALRIKDAAFAWAVHNHPSGAVELSRADLHLSLTMKRVFEPSSITFMGLAAVGASKGEVRYSNESGKVVTIKPSGKSFSVPIVERTLEGDAKEGVNSTASLRVYLRKVSNYNPGLLLLNAQNEVTGWIPIQQTGQFRRMAGTETFTKLIGSMSQGGAVSAVLANPGRAFDPQAIKNIGNALKYIDVGLIDVQDINTNESMAEQGTLPGFRGPVFALSEEPGLLEGYDRQEALDKQKREEEALKKEQQGQASKPAGRKVTADQVDLFNPQESLFARGGQPPLDRQAQQSNTMPVAQVRKVVQGLIGGWKNAPEVRVVENHLQLPVPAPRNARGLYHNGVVWIVARAHSSPTEVAKTLAHEAVAHHGLREILGEREWDRMMHNIQLAIASGNTALRGISADIRRLYIDPHGRFNLDVETESDEIAARAVENAIDPATGYFRPGYGFLKESYAKVAQWLRDVVGIKIPFTMAELHGMLLAAQKNLAVGQRTQGGGQSVAVAALGNVNNELKDAIQRWTGADVAKAAPELERARALKQLRSALDDDSMSDEDKHQMAYNWQARSYEYAPASGQFGDGPTSVAATMTSLTAKRAAAGVTHGPVVLPWGSKFAVVIDGKVIDSFDTQEQAQESVDDYDPDSWRGEFTDVDGNDRGFVRWSEAGPALFARAEAAIPPDRQAALKPSTAPLDTVLRVFGGSLAARITSPAYAWLARTLDRLTPESVKAGVVSDYGLREDYLDAKQGMKTAQRRHARNLGDVIDGLQNLDRQQSRVAYFWMQERPDTQAEQEMLAQLPEQSRATLLALKDRIDALGQEAVQLGLISAETIERNRMAYLHRSYKRYEGEDGPAARAARSSAIKLLGDQFKMRGLRDDTGMDKIAALDWFKRKTKEGKSDVSLKGEKFVRLERRATPDQDTPDMVGDRQAKLGRLREVVYWPASEEIPRHLADWRNDGVWESRFFDKAGKVGMWRDFTLEERTAMGEIQEVRYGIAKTIMQMSRDVETARFLDWIARNESKADESLLPDDAVKHETASMNLAKTYTTKEWVQVPASAIPGTGGLKRYGNLAGRWVPGPIWNDLRQISSITEQDVISRVYGPMLRAWKISKTALSPPTHMNNVMANFIMADAHDIQAKHMLAAMRAFTGFKTNPLAKELIEAFEDNGGDAGMFNNEEIKREIFEPLLKQLEDDLRTETGPNALAIASHVFTLLRAGEFRQAFSSIGQTQTAKMAGAPMRKLIKLYAAEDEFFRLAAFIKAREDGLNDHDAGKFARESFLNYEINAPWIAALRKSFMPFVAFTYRAAPMMAKIAADRPWKIAKWMMVAGALNAFGYMMSGGDEDKERAFLPDEKSGGVWGLVPKMIRMPWNDKYGQPVFLDIRRWIPVGDIVDMGQSHSAVPIPPPLMPGGPMVVAGEIVANTSLFTGQKITKETDTLAEKYAKLADYLWKAAVPNLPGLPGTYSTDSMLNAGKGKTDTFGREQSLPQAMASSVGVKLGSYPPDVLQANEAAKMMSEIGELRRGLRSDARQLVKKGMTQAEFDQRAKDVREKINERTGEFDEKRKRASLADGKR